MRDIYSTTYFDNELIKSDLIKSVIEKNKNTLFTDFLSGILRDSPDGITTHDLLSKLKEFSFDTSIAYSHDLLDQNMVSPQALMEFAVTLNPPNYLQRSVNALVEKCLKNGAVFKNSLTVYNSGEHAFFSLSCEDCNNGKAAFFYVGLYPPEDRAFRIKADREFNGTLSGLILPVFSSSIVKGIGTVDINKLQLNSIAVNLIGKGTQEIMSASDPYKKDNSYTLKLEHGGGFIPTELNKLGSRLA
jgi:hypothetical protein